MIIYFNSFYFNYCSLVCFQQSSVKLAKHNFSPWGDISFKVAGEFPKPGGGHLATDIKGRVKVVSVTEILKKTFRNGRYISQTGVLSTLVFGWCFGRKGCLKEWTCITTSFY